MTLKPDEMTPETWAIVGGRPEPVPGAPLNTPVVAASTFVLGGERIYSRNEATEGWEAFEAMLGGLEGGEAVASLRDGGVRRRARPASERCPPGAGRRLLPGRGRDRRGRRPGPPVARRRLPAERSPVAAASLRGRSAVAGVPVESAA